MPLNFPANPQVGNTHVVGNKVYTWTGQRWMPGSSVGMNLSSVGSHVIPTSNVTYDLGTSSLRWRDLYLSGNSLYLGGAVITAANNAVVLPAGSVIGTAAIGSGGATVTVSNTVPATTTQGSLWFDADTGDLSVYASGGWAGVGTGPIGATGPTGAPGSSVSVVRITALDVTDNSYTVLDDTAVDTTGGYIRITGANFASGCMVYVGLTPAASTTFISSTEIRAQLSATAAGTYPVYVVNTDGSTAIRVPGVTFSANPAWQTASALPDQFDGVAITLNLVATDATSYTVTSGSLPPGLSLNANTGVISGTVTGVANDTVYTFTVRATDAQLQDSPRTFTVTITVSDPYFKLTTLLLSGSAMSANTVVRDSSTNNFNLTVFGDARASNFTPYGGAWSNYFSTGKLTVAQNAAFNFGTSNFTIECWINVPNTTVQFGKSIVDKYFWSGVDNGWLLTSQRNSAPVHNLAFYMNESGGAAVIGLSYNGTFTTGIWHHVAVTRSGTTAALYLDGNIVASQSSVTGNDNYSSALYLGSNSGTNATNSFDGYISNLRIIKGQALFTGNFSPANSALSVSSVVHTGANVAASITGNVSLLTSQSNRLLDNSPNSFIFTKTNTVDVNNFNPFNIANTGIDGSMYFDGTGDYCTTSGNAAFALGTGDFCLETWIYPNSISTGTFDRIVATSDYNGTGFDWTLNTASSALYVAGTAYSISNLVIKSWNHLVYTRSSGVLRGFLNGNLAVYNASATGNVTSTGELRIGTGYSGTAYSGYISNLRIVKGSIPVAYQTSSTTVSTSIFSLPTTLLTAVTGTSLLTLQYDQPHNNHTFLDSSSNQFVVNRAGNATQGTFSPFSQAGWSNYFGGSPYLSIADTASLNFAGDFTVECWVYITGGSSARAIIHKADTNIGYEITLLSGGNLTVSCGSLGLTGSVVLPIGQWVHIAIVRNGVGTNNFKLYVNGNQDGQGTNTSATGGAVTLGIAAVARSGAAGVNPFTGYISNVRISSLAIYTSAFPNALPTGPFTPTASTVLLSCQANRFIDNSSSPKTITVNGAPSVQAWSPFAPTAVYSPAVHGGSGYFDGTGDYLALPTSNAMLYPESGTFTFECWIYPTGTLATLQSVFSYGGSAGNLRVFIQNGGLQLWNGATSFTAGNTALVKNNAWNHIVVQRDSSGYLTSYVNGTRDYYTVQTVNYNAGSLQIAADGGANLYTGYESGFSFIKGSATYSGATITVPTAPLTNTTNTSLLLNFTDTAVQDLTGRNVIETVGDAKTSSVVTKFTGGSMYFDGTGDYLAIPISENTGFGTGDFTIEGWAYLNATSGFSTIISNRTNGSDLTTGRWSLAFRNTALEFYVSGSALISSGTVTTSTWTHFAITRSSNSVRLFLSGTQVGSTTSLTTSLPSLATWIGANGAGTETLNGYIQDLRITRGYARYTGNFTAPTAPARLK